MATRELELPVESAYPLDTTAPAWIYYKSSAGAPTPVSPCLSFDASTDEIVMWSFIVPNDFVTSAVLRVFYKMASAITGAVRYECFIQCVTPGDSQDIDTNNYDSTNNTGDTVPGTAGYMKTFTITLTNRDSMAAGDYCILRLNRDADGTTGTDDATGDCEVVAVNFEYSDV